MTRSIITELFVRVLALWLIIGQVPAIPAFYSNIGEAGFPLWMPLVGVAVILFTAIMMIIFSKEITKLIWLGRRNDDEPIVDDRKKDLLIPLIATLGLFFAVRALLDILYEITKFLNSVNFYSYYPRHIKETQDRLVFSLMANALSFILGALIFFLPEKLVNFRNEIFKKYFHKYENEND